MYVASIPGVIERFNISTTLAISPISFYSLGLSLGPLISASTSEVFGRRIIFAVSLPLCLAFTIVAGSATEFRTIAVARFLASVAGSPCVTVTIAIINDVWDVERERIGTLLTVLFAVMMVISTELGPLIGATIIQGQDWRWTFWIASIFIGLSIAVVLPNPETYKPEILRRRAKKMKIEVSRRELKSVVLVAVGRPLHMLVTEPIMWPTALVVAVYQAILFCFYVAYPLMFERVYLFTTFKVGLAFIPLLVGSLLAIPIVAYLDKAKYQKEKADAEREGRPIRPESRLYAAMVGSILMPISLFW